MCVYVFSNMCRMSILSRADEHVRKSVFREVLKYTESTKLGLKVFHLQQLSQTGFRNLDLINDDPFIRLKKDLFVRESLIRLSPAQMVATCVALGKLGSTNKKEWTLLGDSLKGLCRNLSPSQIGVCLYAFSRTMYSWTLKHATVDLLCKALLRKSVDWTLIDMGWYLYFIRKTLGADETRYLPLIDQIAYRFNERLTKSTPRNIACIMSEFGYLKILPGHAIHRASNILGSKRQKIDPKTMTLLFASLAKLNVYKISLVNTLADHVIQQNKTYTNRQVVTVFYATAKLAIYHRKLTRLVCKHFQNLSKLTETDLAMLAYSFGRFRIRGHIWNHLLNIFNSNFLQYTPQTVSIFLGALSRVNTASDSRIRRLNLSPDETSYVDQAWLEKIDAFVIKNRAGFTDRQILNSIHSLCKMGYASKSDWRKLKLDPTLELVETQLKLIQEFRP